MKVCRKLTCSVFSSIIFLIGTLVVALSPVMAAGPSAEQLIWVEYALGTGEAIVSPPLLIGRFYRIVADDRFYYNLSDNLAADAQYYTTDFSNSWDWGNFFPAPGGGSFLQIDGENVSWGPFSNGDTGHTYTIYRYGADSSITFEIEDWVDGNLTNNGCKIRVRIYETVTVGGHVVDFNLWEMVALGTIGAVIVVVLVAPVVLRYRKLIAK